MSETLTAENFDGLMQLRPHMAVHLRRGLSAKHKEVVLPFRTAVYTQDDKMLHIHDGITPGGLLHFRLVEASVDGS